MGSYPADLLPGHGKTFKPCLFNLSDATPNKTIDLGRNGFTLSVDPYGRILQLSGYHPKHGVILAAPYEQFDETRYYEPSYVRQYRNRMLEMIGNGDNGFGIRIQKTLPRVAITLQSANAALINFETENGANVECYLKVQDDGTISQQIAIKNRTCRKIEVSYLMDLKLSVHRASYGQLTEGGPIPLPDCENQLLVRSDKTAFTISNSALDAHLSGHLYVEDSAAPLAGLSNADERGVLSSSVTNWECKSIEPGSTVNMVASFKLCSGLETTNGYIEPPVVALETTDAGSCWKDTSSCKSYIIRRNLDYIIGNCCIPVGDDSIGIITDHVALPLGWNRDNYWQLRLLHVARRNMSTLVTAPSCSQYCQSIDRVLKGHLNWVYKTAQRPHGFWHRSYIITGRPKDGPTFQLDQQCYPLLELCDYFQQFPDDCEFVLALLQQPTVGEILSLLASKRDPTTKLYPTDETPGDDAVDFPFHFSSHVLLWHTLQRLAEVFRVLGPAAGISAEHTQCLADSVRETSLKHFVKRDNVSGHVRIAYLVDGHGHETFYHDANDVPTIFATQWGFLSSTEELEGWRNTMKFATSADNKLGYSTGGPFTGLGSVHSKGPWPLGYFQELLYAHAIGDEPGKEDAWRKIVGSMQWDGTFGEAVDVSTGKTTSKAWFSWPGSMIAAALIEGVV